MIENQQDSNKLISFSAVWPRTSPRLRRAMGLTMMFAVAAAGAAGTIVAAAGLAPLWAVTGAAAFSAVYTAALHGPRRYNITEKEVRQIGGPAPAAFTQIADDLLLKAGLADRYKADVLLLDESLHPDYHNEHFSGTIFGEDTDYNVFILPRPAGLERDRVLIGVGCETATLFSKADLTAVLAHELGHFINRPPHLNPLLTAARIFPVLLTAASVLALAPAAALAAVGAGAVIKLCSRRLYILDEERADRTSLGLYPAPRALESAMDKIMNNFGSPVELTGVFNRAAEWATRTHPTRDQRVKANEVYAVESLALHRSHNIPADPGAYARRVQGRENPLRPHL